MCHRQRSLPCPLQTPGLQKRSYDEKCHYLQHSFMDWRFCPVGPYHHVHPRIWERYPASRRLPFHLHTAWHHHGSSRLGVLHAYCLHVVLLLGLRILVTQAYGHDSCPRHLREEQRSRGKRCERHDNKPADRQHNCAGGLGEPGGSQRPRQRTTGRSEPSRAATERYSHPRRRHLHVSLLLGSILYFVASGCALSRRLYSSTSLRLCLLDAVR